MLLDLDGTLLDLAPTPAEVVVPPGLRDVLHRLRARCADALAVVTGRPIEQIELPSGRRALRGGGRAWRGDSLRAGSGGVPPGAAGHARGMGGGARPRSSRACPARLLEPKPRGFVLHYRLAPEAGPALEAAARRIVGDEAERFAILPAHMAWEIKPRGADKGTAVEALMAKAPFAGRTPVYIGDDTTDEDGMRAARPSWRPGPAGSGRVPDAGGREGVARQPDLAQLI